MTTPSVLNPSGPALQLNLIMDFEVRCDGEPVPIAPASQRLVCFLAFQPRPVRRTYVSGTLWYDADDRHASSSLRSALWRLQPMELVCVSNTHLWLNPCVQVDLRRVIDRAEGVLRSEPDAETVFRVAQELIEVGNDILAGWYEDWVIVERERFRQVRLHAMDRIGELLIQQGRWYDALQVALAAISTEPLRESAHRLLVKIHLQEGNIAEAIHQYRSYAELLRRELNGRPSAAIRELLAPFVVIPAPAGAVR